MPAKFGVFDIVRFDPDRPEGRQGLLGVVNSVREWATGDFSYGVGPLTEKDDMAGGLWPEYWLVPTGEQVPRDFFHPLPPLHLWEIVTVRSADGDDDFDANTPWRITGVYDTKDVLEVERWPDGELMDIAVERVTPTGRIIPRPREDILWSGDDCALIDDADLY